MVAEHGSKVPAGQPIAMPMSIVAYMPGFELGGVQRLTLLLLEFLSTQGYSVSVVVHQAVGELLEHMSPRIRIVDLRASRTLRAVPKLAAWLRKERPDVLLSCLGHNNIAAIGASFLARSGTSIVISQHNALTAETRALGNWQHRVLPLLYRLVGARADGIVAVSEGVAQDMSDSTGLSRERISVIPNPVVDAGFAETAGREVSHRWLDDPAITVFVAVGRLVPQKDFGTLLAAFARILTQRDARLLIVGEGPERAAIEKLAQKLGIADKVELAGFCNNPLPYMRKADAFVLSSRYEGFGNVIVESLACGTSVVSTNCPFGPAEILEDGRYGRLVEVGNAEAMAAAMLEVLLKPFSPELLRARAAEFSVDIIGRRYMELFDYVRKRKSYGKPSERPA
jgi:glycosyltransferase involved in cell wall biosynthesis